MKKTILILIFILCLPLAYSLYGGESKVISSFEKCLNLTIDVNASLPIDEGEFSFLNCSEINRSHWFCNCSDNFNLTLTTKINTVNNYTFNIFYYNYSEVIEEQTSSGGSSSSKKTEKECNPYWKCTEWTSCQKNNRATRECNDLNKCNKDKSEKRICHYVTKEKELEKPIEELQEEETKAIEEIDLPFEEKEKKNWWLYILIGLGSILLICIGLFIYWYFHD